MFPGRVAGSCERTRRRMTPKKLLPIDRLFPKFAERERAKRALVNQLASMSTEALGLVIEEIDEDGSGEIEFDEFKALLQSD